jgi:hypothetical protein
MVVPLSLISLHTGSMARYLLFREFERDTPKFLSLFAIERGRDLTLLPLDSTSSIVPIKAITAKSAAREKYPIAVVSTSKNFRENLWRFVMNCCARSV